MQSKRDGLIPICDALSGLGGSIQAIRDASPRRGTTSPRRMC